MNKNERNNQPPMNADERRLDGITEKIIGCAFEVSNTLGCGFAEKVSENALAHELRLSGLSVQQQASIPVRYKGVLVGDYTADLLVESCVLVELKCVKHFDDAHLAQAMNYLTGTGLKVCRLINFGTSKVQVKRVVRGFEDRRSSASIGG